MTEIEFGTCPLCFEQFPLKDLRIHAKRESEEAKEYTLAIIKAQHPEWVEDGGICPKCWEYYKKL